jgi:hypothetical protein
MRGRWTEEAEAMRCIVVRRYGQKRSIRRQGEPFYKALTVLLEVKSIQTSWVSKELFKYLDFPIAE